MHAGHDLTSVPGASVTLLVHFPNEDRTLIMPLTDEKGLSPLALSFEDQTPGSDVSLEFWVARGGIQATTRESFRIWW